MNEPAIQQVHPSSPTFRISCVRCHSNQTRALIANPPNRAQLGGTVYHSPKLHPGSCSSVGMRREIDTHRHTDERDQHAFRLAMPNAKSNE